MEHCQDLEKALSACARGLAIKKEIGDLDGQGNIYYMMSYEEYYRGDEKRSVELRNVSIQTMDQAGNGWFAASFRCDLAYYFIQRGNNEDAASLLETAFRLAHILRSPSLMMYCEMVQGYLSLETTDYEQAAHACERVIAMNEDFPFRRITHIFYILARVALATGEVSRARAALKDMLDHNAFADGESRLRMIHILGLLSGQEGKWEHAATWLGVADAMYAQSYWASHFLSPMEQRASEQTRAASRQALGEDAFCAGWKAGRVMSEEHILKFAEESLI